MKIDINDVVVASNSQLSTNVGNETVVLHVDKGEYFGLNEVGATIWQLVQQPRTIAEIRSELLAEYDVPPEQCEKDLLQILAQLAEAGLIDLSFCRSARQKSCCCCERRFNWSESSLHFGCYPLPY